jgi:putative endonuclease
MQEHYVYILTSKRNGTLYVGMAGDLKARIKCHKNKTASKFTKDYEVNKLVYFEKCKNKQTASEREKQLKKYNRRWKIRLIEQLNPTWKDLSSDVINEKNPGSPAEDRGS